MNTKSPVILAALVAAFLARAEAAPACCPVEPVATPACCATMPAAAPLTDRSIYQLESDWTNDAGATVQLASLRGRPVIVAMFFAQCEYACPMLVSDIQRVRAALPEDIRARVQVVLVSFDTVRDTPEALAAYRERLALDASWTLLRGEPAVVQDLAMLLGVKYTQGTTGQFSHSNLLTVLNAEGEVIHQRNGLMGDVSETAEAVLLTSR